MTYQKKIRTNILNSKNIKSIPVVDISYTSGISRSTIYKWDKMTDVTPPRKRASKITPSIRAFIVTHVCNSIVFNRFKLIDEINTKFGVNISKSSIYNILKSSNVTRKKIYYRHIPTNKEKRKQQIKNFIDKVKKIPINNIVSIDETSIDTHINPNYGWNLSGKKISIKNSTSRKRYTVICAINNKGIIFTKIINNSANGEDFIEFINQVVNKLPINREKQFFLMGNARIHHYKKFKDNIKQTPNIELLYNVPYSPEYNPIEYVFNEAKKIIKDKIWDTRNIINQINDAFNKVSKVNINKYFVKSLTFN